MRCRARQLAPLVTLLAAVGCGRVDRLPSAPARPQADLSTAGAGRFTAELPSQGIGSFYPLEIGNRWQYAIVLWQTNIPYGGEPRIERISYVRERVLVGTEIVRGRLCVREEGERRDSLGTVHHTLRWLWQDRSGLYELATPAPGRSPFPHRQLLAYPLHVGATWPEGERWRGTRTVDGIDVLDTPQGRVPAWRIHVRYPPLRDNIQLEAFEWYGRVGLLGTKFRDAVKAIAPGQVTVIQETTESLTGISLTTRAR
jgi:hypothetical protein